MENFIHSPKVTNAIYSIIYNGKKPDVIVPLKDRLRGGNEFQEKLRNLAWREGNSLPEALKKAEQIFQTESRPGSRKVLVYFVNETPERPLTDVSEDLEEFDIKVVPVAISETVDEDILRKTNPKSIVVVVKKGGKPEEEETTIEGETLSGKCYKGLRSTMKSGLRGQIQRKGEGGRGRGKGEGGREESGRGKEEGRKWEGEVGRRKVGGGREKGEGGREKGEGRREKGEGRREKGEGGGGGGRGKGEGGRGKGGGGRGEGEGGRGRDRWVDGQTDLFIIIFF